MAHKPKAASNPAVVVVPALPPAAASAPDPALFVWKGAEYDLNDFAEFRHWFDHDKRTAHAKFLRAGGGEVSVPVETTAEAQAIERAVNPFWGRT